MPVASVDPMASRMRRTFPAVGAALLALALVTGCAPEPAPTPTPTGFASDDEAFAAAEATYRAYVDALNAVDLSDPATFEPVYANLSGQALADEKKSLTTMSAEGWVVSGESKVRAFFHGSATESCRTGAIAISPPNSPPCPVDRSCAELLAQASRASAPA